MSSLIREFFKKIDEDSNAFDTKDPLQVLHPYIAEGYSDLLEDTEWKMN